MRFTTIITVLASVAAASNCKGKRIPQVQDLTVSQAQATCGNDMTVQCCNKVTNKAGGANGNGGLLGLNLLNDLSLFDGCSDLSLNVVGILDGLLSKK
ncbi:hypothetical protein ACLX1H_004607 [Fusarium chlamydosporum]